MLIQSIQGKPEYQNQINRIIHASYILGDPNHPLLDISWKTAHPKLAKRIAILNPGTFYFYKAQTQRYFVMSDIMPKIGRLKCRTYGEEPTKYDYKYCMVYQRQETSYLMFADSIQHLIENIGVPMAAALRPRGTILKPIGTLRGRTYRLLKKIRLIHDCLFDSARTTLSLEQRIPLVQEIYQQLGFKLPRNLLRSLPLHLDEPWPDGYTEFSFITQDFHEFFTSIGGERLALCADRRHSILCHSKIVPTMGYKRLGRRVKVTVSYTEGDKNCKLHIVDNDFVDSSRRRTAYALWEKCNEDRASELRSKRLRNSRPQRKAPVSFDLVKEEGGVGEGNRRRRAPYD